MSDAPQESRPSFGVVRLAEETRERFVREIVARVPLPRLVELHLFAPMRQGGMESGVAVLAALLDVSEEEAATPPAAPSPSTPGAVVPAIDEALIVERARDVELGEDGVDDAGPPERCDPTDAAAGPSPGGDAAEQPADSTPVDGGRGVDIAELVADPAVAPAAPAPRAPRLRHTVFTARYRLVLKGPERGRWDVEVREEADAPLITVEAVVRGVLARAGDAGDPERLDGGMVARLLGVADGAG